MSSERGAEASALEVAELADNSARMSMSADDSVTSTVAAAGAGACLASVASEKSTLLSLRSPVSGAWLAALVSVAGAHTSPLGWEESTGIDSPQRLQRTLTRRPSRRSSARVYLALHPGHVSFIILSDPSKCPSVGAKISSNHRPRWCV